MYKIGSIIVNIPNPENIPEKLQHFLRDKCEGVHQATLIIETVEHADWDKELNEGLTQIDGKWQIGRNSHHIQYCHEEKTFTLRAVKKLGTIAMYWLRRDLFGALGTVSGEPLLHSSSVVRDNLGYVFCAHSGTGKSTILGNLINYATAVNDETNWLTKVDANWYLVDQNYYFGESDKPLVPLKEIFLLKQSPTCKITEDTESIETFHLMLAVHLPFDYQDPYLETRTKSVTAMMKEVKAKRLHVNLKPSEIASTIFDL